MESGGQGGPRPRAAESPWRRARPAAFALFVLVTGLLALLHEPWRDEAQSWLLARDADPWTLMSYLAGHEATPVLWHLVNMPFAQADFPYATQRIVNAAFVILAAWLVLWRAPLPPWARLGVVFSAYLLFEFNAVARSYGLGAMLLFLALALDGARARRPVLYGAVLGLLANTHVFGLLFAFALGLVWLGALRAGPRGAILAGMALAVAAGLFAVWQVLPPGDNLRSAGIAPPRTPEAARAVRMAGLALSPDFWKLAPLPPGSAAALAGLAALWGALLWPIRGAPRALAFFALAAAGLAYIAIFERRIDARHAAHLMLALIAALWLGGAAIWRGRAAMDRLARATLAGVLALSALSGAREVQADLRHAYSPGRGMAEFIRREGLAARPIVADRAPNGSAVLPYLPDTRLWYPALQVWGTYIVWRGGLSEEPAAAELLAEIAALDLSGALILTERRLEGPGLRLLHVERSRGGRLFLYAAGPAP